MKETMDVLFMMTYDWLKKFFSNWYVIGIR